MNNNECVSSIGYTEEEFLLRKDVILKNIKRIIVKKEKRLGLTKESVKKEIEVISKKDKFLTGGVLIATTAGTVALDRLFPNTSYVLCLASPIFIMTSMYIFDKKHVGYQNRINMDMDMVRSIGLYEALYNFISDGEELGVSLLKDIYREVCNDNDMSFHGGNSTKSLYAMILRLLDGIRYYDDDDYIYVEELCSDVKLNRGKCLVRNK